VNALTYISEIKKKLEDLRQRLVGTPRIGGSFKENAGGGEGKKQRDSLALRS